MRIGAANSCLRPLSLHAPTALRAHRRYLHRLFLARALVAHNSQHLGDNLSSFVNNNPVANANILSLDEILVMQRGSANDAAAEPHRRQHSRRRKHTRAAYAPVDILQRSFRLFRRIFKGDGPAWVLAGGAQGFLLLHSIDLNDCAISIVS